MADGRPATPLTGLTRAEQLDALRARIAAVPGKVGATTASPAAPSPGVQPPPEVIEVPGDLGSVLPAGGLARGSVVGCTSGSLLVGLLAAATQAGEWAAMVGNPRLGLLAFHEMGGDLERLAHIADPGPDPLAVTAILLDGLGVVVLDYPGTVAPSRARAVAARVRSHGAVLIVTTTGWMRPDVQIHTRTAGYTGLGHGRGRLQAVHLDVRVTSRSTRPRTTRLTLHGSTPDRTRWSTRSAADVVRPGWEQTG
ncbi:hypothetical protein [Nocardia noduli]|uniref:hypothetical protein n=1 Tax=Nocardia noduli TaxID=2815722 RepID=UPI001C2409AF|nr:hypothetical protein [Nocardia noduli]